MRRFFALENVTRFHDGRRIDRDVSFINVLDYAFFIDQEGGAIAETLLLIENAVVFDDRAFEVAEQRKRNLELFGEFSVGGNTVYTQSENLSFGGFELGDISLICLQFFRSTAGEREYIYCEYDVFLAFEIAELVGLAVGSAKGKVWRRITDL